MDIVNLKYGKSSLELTKSDKYIAIRPVSNRKRKVNSVTMVPENVLGGFELYMVENDSNMNNLEKVEETLDTLREHTDVQAGTHVYYTSDDEVPFVPTGELYVEFNDGADNAKCQELIDRFHLMLAESRGDNSYIFTITEASENPLKVAAQLQENSDIVKTAEPSLATIAKLQCVVLPDDGLIKDQWHLRNTGYHRGTRLSLKAGADARVIDAWDKSGTLGSRDVIVAVIDDGFDLKHPDLSGMNKIHAPWDFTRNNNEPLPGPGDAHGTSCAGVAVGNANSSGIVGAAPNCKLMPVRWGTNLTDTQIENWFRYVAGNGAWIVSCSWGAAARRFVLSTRMEKAISDCAVNGRNGKGIVICFAAANANTDIDADETYNGFATHKDVVAVAACTSVDTKSHYSCFGQSVFICAPSSGAGGMGILTSDVRGMEGYDPGDYTYDFGGTSSATPLVAGICALIASVNPGLTGQEIKDVLRQTARRIGGDAAYDANGHSVYYGYGCADAAAAVLKAAGGEVNVMGMQAAIMN